MALQKTPPSLCTLSSPFLWPHCARVNPMHRGRCGHSATPLPAEPAPLHLRPESGAGSQRAAGHPSTSRPDLLTQGFLTEPLGSQPQSSWAYDPEGATWHRGQGLTDQTWFCAKPSSACTCGNPPPVSVEVQRASTETGGIELAQCHPQCGFADACADAKACKSHPGGH